jgi:hypothetical protein
MCQDGANHLSFETLLNDPLIRLVMDADGVTPQALIAPLAAARDAIAARELTVFRSVLAAPAARSVRA